MWIGSEMGIKNSFSAFVYQSTITKNTETKTNKEYKEKGKGKNKTEKEINAPQKHFLSWKEGRKSEDCHFLKEIAWIMVQMSLVIQQ